MRPRAWEAMLGSTKGVGMSTAVHRLGPSKRPVARAPARRVRSGALGVFFASVAVNAALGIYAVLAPDFGETEGKILATSLFVTGAVLLALASEPAWERGLLGPVPYAGALLGALAFALAIVAVWAEPEAELYVRIMATIFTIAAGCALASLLALARLAPRHRWVSLVTFGLLSLAGAVVAVAWWWDDPHEAYVRGMGAVLIALAAFAVSLPVLHWVDRGALAAAEPATDAVRFCPHCGARLAGTLGAALVCGRCGRAFGVTAAHPPT